MATETTQNQINPKFEPMLEQMGNLLTHLLNAQNEIWNHVKQGVIPAKEANNLTPCINNTAKIINQCNTFMRRYNIETQGYDSSVRRQTRIQRSNKQNKPTKPTTKHLK